MRRALLNAAFAIPVLALTSTSALAQNYDDDRDQAEYSRDFQTEAVEKLNDPRFQEQMGDVMGAMMQAMMSMKIGGIAEAAGKIDPNSRMAHIDPDTTVGDMVADGDPHYADRMADKTRMMAKTTGVMASSMAKMLPVLANMAQEMGAQMEKSVGREMRKMGKDLDRQTN